MFDEKQCVWERASGKGLGLKTNKLQAFPNCERALNARNGRPHAPPLQQNDWRLTFIALLRLTIVYLSAIDATSATRFCFVAQKETDENRSPSQKAKDSIHAFSNFHARLYDATYEAVERWNHEEHTLRVDGFAERYLRTTPKNQVNMCHAPRITNKYRRLRENAKKRCLNQNFLLLYTLYAMSAFFAPDHNKNIQ
jgi:hypothetical protein